MSNRKRQWHPGFAAALDLELREYRAGLRFEKEGAAAMDDKKKMPAVGLEDFEKLRRRGGYYVDKTGMVAELLRSPAEVTLFTRPRRFGKTLNMTMLKSFFEIGTDPALFDGLAISGETDLCEQYMGKYPVVFVTLKDMDGSDFSTACRLAAARISEEASRFGFLAASPFLDEEDKELYAKLRRRDMTLDTLSGSLKDFCRLLEKHYGRKTVLLIDEYDVPLQKAFYNGYYDEMVRLIRSMFSQALKTNMSLELAVLTGCLRISKESIFTGMNNLSVMTVADEDFADCFGFTDGEVREMLKYYSLSGCYGTARDWYDGYRFGSVEVYCPWDVVSYVGRLQRNPKAQPENFWANSSGNDVVRDFVQKVDVSVAAEEMEALVAGEIVRKEIRQELTYREMYSSIENLWSLLYMTGYLTKRGEAEGRLVPLSLPNMEIRDIFTAQIMDLFKEQVARDGDMVRKFCDALLNGDAGRAEELLGQYLKKTVSIRDTFGQRNLRENFYHGILLGILSYKGNWYVTSNYETGDGYGDILVRNRDEGWGIVIEVKYAHGGNLEKEAEQALKQIRERRYDEKLRDCGIGRVLKYGIACYRKQCRVVLMDAEV